jgi:hypothetical protein
MTGNELKQLDGGAKITFGCKEYEVVLDFNAICDLEEKYGNFDNALKILDDIGNDLTKRGAMENIRFLFYVMLRHSDDKLTEHEAGRLITMQNIQRIVSSLGTAMTGTGSTEKNADSPQK